MLNSLTPTDLAILAAVFLGVWHYFDTRATRKQPSTAPAPAPQLTADLEKRLLTLETAVQGLPSLWATERARVTEQAEIAKRADARTRETERRLKKRSEVGDGESDDGPVALEIPFSDGARGREGQLRAVRADMAPPLAGTPAHKVVR